MSEENIESIRQSVEAFDRGDKSAWLTMFDPEAEMFPAREWPEQAPIKGAAAIWDFYVAVTEAWESGSFEVGEVIEAGTDAVVANTRRETRGKASGASVVFSYWTLTTFSDGKTLRVEWFSDRAQALEAAGLSE
jgi:ketosteroid isomerase-like protein